MSSNCIRGETVRLRSGATARLEASFTLIELMASMAILGLIMLMLFSVFDQVNKAWLGGENRVETFTQARAVMDIMSRELSQAIATPNIAFYGDPTHVYFVAPVNIDTANQADLCEVGYEYFPGAAPSFYWEITRRLIQPNTANVGVSGAWNIHNATWWNSYFLGKPINPLTETSAVLATNSILGIQFQYEDANGNFFGTWPNPNRLPYAIVINMIAVDSRTATKLKSVPNIGTAWQSITNSTLRTFSTTVYLSNN